MKQKLPPSATPLQDCSSSSRSLGQSSPSPVTDCEQKLQRNQTHKVCNLKELAEDLEIRT